MMQNQWTSTWVGASWAMLAQDDTSLKPSWRKMTERIDFSLIFGAVLEYQNRIKINEKMKWFSDTLKNRVFCAGRSQSLQNGGSKRIQNNSLLVIFLGPLWTHFEASWPQLGTSRAPLWPNLVPLELHFGGFGTFLRRKHSFLGCLKITSFFHRFLYHFGIPKWS